MKTKQEEKVTFPRVVKQVRDDIEDGKLDKTLKDLEKQYPVLFLKATILNQINKPHREPPTLFPTDNK